MKKILLILFFVIFAFGCSEKTKNIAIFGDSLVADSRWISVISNKNNKIHIDCYGVKGATIYETGMTIARTLMTNEKYDTIIIWCGINDVAKSVDMIKSENSINAISFLLELLKIKTYWMSVPNCYYYKYYNDDEGWCQKIDWINRLLEVQNKKRYINCNNSGIWGDISYKICTDDGLHLNEIGNKKIGNIVSSFLYKN